MAKKSYFKYRLDPVGNAIYSAFATMKINSHWLSDMLDIIDGNELDADATLKSMKDALQELVADFELAIDELEKLMETEDE
jgi:hypothetical protein